MKLSKKSAALIAAAAMLLCLTACGSFETKVAKAVRAMSRVDNMHMDMSMDIALGVKVLGKTIGTDVTMAGSMDVQTDPLTAKTEVTVAAAGIDKSVLTYVEKTDAGYDVYVSDDDGDDWDKETVTESGAPTQINIVDGLQLFVDCAASFEEAGEERVMGAEAVRYDGVITGSEVKRVMELTGAGDMLSRNLGVTLSDEDFSNLGDIPASVWIDKETGMLVRYDMDMTSVVRSVLPELVGGLTNSLALKNLSSNLEVSSASFSAVLSRFNQVGEVTIPDAVRAAD